MRYVILLAATGAALAPSHVTNRRTVALRVLTADALETKHPPGGREYPFWLTRGGRAHATWLGFNETQIELAAGRYVSRGRLKRPWN